MTVTFFLLIIFFPPLFEQAKQTLEEEHRALAAFVAKFDTLGLGIAVQIKPTQTNASGHHNGIRTSTIQKLLWVRDETCENF